MGCGRFSRVRRHDRRAGQRWSALVGASERSHGDTATSRQLVVTAFGPADDLAGVVLQSDQAAYPNWRSSRRGAPGGRVL